jgi:hypothetical protein
LEREKAWHATLNGERLDTPLELLAQCRQDLKRAISRADSSCKAEASRWSQFADLFGFSITRWSVAVAAASFLVIAGFTAGRWVDRNGIPGSAQSGNFAESGLMNAPSVRVRDIQPGGNDRVRIVLDQTHEKEVIGRVGDDDVRQLLLSAMKDSDPGIRVDSVEVLTGQNATDVRDALISSAQYDPNAAVRLKAVDALRSFVHDPGARDALRSVLQGDNDPGVRAEAIDVLAPAGEKSVFSPDLAATLQQIMRSEPDDDYVRMRCLRLLREMKASSDVY